MFEAKNKKEALKYIIHISYNKTSEGSGVIVPIKGKEYSYVLTAKHTFEKDKEERGDEYTHIQKNDIKKKTIVLNTSSNIKLEVLDILILENEPTLDFLIIKVKNNFHINSLKQLDIYEEDFNYCLPYGYPESSRDGHTSYEPFNCEYKPISSPDKLEIRIIEFMSVKANKGTISYMSGISGAGIFAENYNKDTIYLVGIVIQGTEEIQQNLVCLDLEKLSKKINYSLFKKGWAKLGISGAEWKNKFGFDISDLDFKKEIEEFNEKSKNKFIKALKYEESFVDKFDNEVKSNLKKEEEKFQKISESYLYIGMNFHQLQAHKRATYYLNKAIEYGGNKNKLYLLDAKSKREEEKTLNKRTEQEKELIRGFIHSLYQEIHEYEEQLINNEKDESIKRLLIDLYNKLIKQLKFFDDRKDEILKIYEKSMKLYSDFNEYDDINEKIITLQNMIDLNKESTLSMKNQVNDYKQEIEDLNKHIQLLSTNISDKTILNKINYQVHKSDKKLDNLSSNISKKIDDRADKIDKTLDNIQIILKKTNNKHLDIFLENIVASNRALVSKIQTINHQDNRHKKAKERLDESINTLNNKLDDLMERPTSGSSSAEFKDINQLKKIVEESNWKFYKAIKGLCENETDSYNRKLLEMSLAFTKREHELYIEKLEKIHFDDILNIKRENTLEKNKLEESISELTNWLEKIDNKYSEEKILELEMVIQRLEAKNEQIDELKKSIKLSSDTADTLVKLSKDNRDKLDDFILRIDNKYQELDNEKKRIFSKEFNEVLGNIYSEIDALSCEPDDNKESFEKILLDLEKLDTKLESFEYNIEEKVDEVHKKVDVYPIKGDPEINLHLKESDLEKIEDIMNKNKRPIWNIYCKVRFVILGVIFMSGLLIVFNGGY